MFDHVLIHSFDKTDVLVETVELIWLLLLNILSFNFVPTSNKFSYAGKIQKKLCNAPCCRSIQPYKLHSVDVRCAVHSGHVFLRLFVPEDSVFAHGVSIITP